MKKISLFFVISLMTMTILAACGNDEVKDSQEENLDNDVQTELSYQPEEINPDVDTCDVCAMAIADDEHATQIILTNDRSLKFDDIGDMFVWIEENGEEDIGAKFVRDYHTKDWIILEEATFVYDEHIETPMGFGVISFKNSEDAQVYIDENELGKLLSAEDLYSHDWEMAGHDHDHH